MTEQPMTIRDFAEQLLEEISGGLCICQRADVPHWCEACQIRINAITHYFRRNESAELATLRAALADRDAAIASVRAYCNRQIDESAVEKAAASWRGRFSDDVLSVAIRCGKMAVVDTRADVLALLPAPPVVTDGPRKNDND